MDEKNSLLAFCQTQQIPAEENVSCRRLTTFQTGGNVRLLVEPENEQQLSALLAYLAGQQLPWFLVGNGSNLLAPEGEINRLLIRLRGDFSTVKQLENGRIWCGAGVSMLRLCKAALEFGLTGLEFAYGIPGTAGGAAFMNAGAYDGEMSGVLTRCDHMDAQGNNGSFAGDALHFGYRDSVYQHQNMVITGMELQLKQGDPEQISARMQELMQRRKDKQPLEKPSAGSTFRRPVGYFAGGLIEQCHLKGLRVGGAMVSTKHAGFLINEDHATTDDVLGLIATVQQRVLKETGVQLACEVRTIPRD